MDATIAKPRQLELPFFKMKTSHLRAGSLRTKEAVIEAVKKALKNCPFERSEVAREVSRLVGEEFSVHTLNNIVAEGKTNRRFPLEYAKALTMITGDIGIIEAALQPEFSTMDKKAKIAHDYGLMVIETQNRNRRKKELEQQAKMLFKEDF